MVNGAAGLHLENCRKYIPKNNYPLIFRYKSHCHRHVFSFCIHRAKLLKILLLSKKNAIIWVIRNKKGIYAPEFSLFIR